MMNVQIFDDDGGLRDHPAIAGEDREAAEWPQVCPFGRRVRVFQMASGERHVVLPEGGRNLLAARRERVGTECERHPASFICRKRDN
jgi:hypothetical protein